MIYKNVWIFLLILCFSLLSSFAKNMDEPTENQNGMSSKTLVHPSMIQFIQEDLRNNLSEKIIIDIGFGWGAEIVYLSKTNAKHIFAIDPSRKHAQELISALKKEKYVEMERSDKSIITLVSPVVSRPSITIIIGSFPQDKVLMNLPSKDWDIVFMNNVIMFMEGKVVNQSFKKIYEKLKRRGIFFLTYTSMFNLFNINDASELQELKDRRFFEYYGTPNLLKIFLMEPSPESEKVRSKNPMLTKNLLRELEVKKFIPIWIEIRKMLVDAGFKLFPINKNIILLKNLEIANLQGYDNSHGLSLVLQKE